MSYAQLEFFAFSPSSDIWLGGSLDAMLGCKLNCEANVFENLSWSEKTSAVAVSISIATLIWTRIDKWRERRALKEAKKPLVNVRVRPITNDRWQATASIENRGDFDLRLDQISVPKAFNINFGDGNGAAPSHTLNQHIVRAGRVGPSFDLLRSSGAAKKLRFVLNFTELNATERKITMRVRRKLPAFE